MSRRDQLNPSKGPSTGNMRSHSLRATRRTWNVNLHWVTLNIEGKPTRVRISTRTLRTLRKSQKVQKNAPKAVAPATPVAAAPAPAAETK